MVRFPAYTRRILVTLGLGLVAASVFLWTVNQAIAMSPQLQGSDDLLQPSDTPYEIGFADTEAAAADWLPLGSTWVLVENGYLQSDKDNPGATSFYRKRIADDYRYEVDVQYLDGEMSGGIVFNAPATDTLSGAYVARYADGGDFLEWGFIDRNNNFQIQGDTAVANGADGEFHRLSVTVENGAYTIVLDGTPVANAVQFQQLAQPYIGLSVHLSQLFFRDARVAVGTLAATVTPTVTATVTGTTTPSATASATPQPQVLQPSDTPYNLNLKAGGGETALWNPLDESWAFTADGYVSDEASLDGGNAAGSVTLYRNKLGGDYEFQLSLRNLGDDLSGGIVFNAASPSSVANAHGVHYQPNNNGTFIQWGTFDESGIFQFSDGRTVPSGEDGQPHLLTLSVTSDRFTVTLDGVGLADGIQFARIGLPHIGLYSAGGQVRFESGRITVSQFVNPTPTPTNTPTETNTPTPTLTPTREPTDTRTPIPTSTRTPTWTPSPTWTPFPTFSPTPTWTPFASPTATPGGESPLTITQPTRLAASVPPAQTGTQPAQPVSPLSQPGSPLPQPQEANAPTATATLAPTATFTPSPSATVAPPTPTQTPGQTPIPPTPPPSATPLPTPTPTRPATLTPVAQALALARFTATPITIPPRQDEAAMETALLQDGQLDAQRPIATPAPTPPPDFMGMTVQIWRAAVASAGWIWFVLGSALFFIVAGIVAGLGFRQQERTRFQLLEEDDELEVLMRSTTTAPPTPKQPDTDDDNWPSSLP